MSTLKVKSGDKSAHVKEHKTRPVKPVKENKAASGSKLSQRDVRFSKSLSWLLRHGANEEGVDMSTDGYIKLNDALALKQFKGCDLETVQSIVANNEKQRFAMKQVGKEWYIRANQGHSEGVGANLNVEEMMTLITTPIVPCIHGTYDKFMASIKATGLNRMSRTHIHMAPGLKEDVTSGFRGDCDTLLYIDMAAAMKDGIKFYLSKNDVILTAGENDSGTLPYRYVNQVVKR